MKDGACPPLFSRSARTYFKEEKVVCFRHGKIRKIYLLLRLGLSYESPSLKRTSVQKSNKNEIFMARVKNSNSLNFCSQVDPSKTRKAVYLCILIFEKNELFAFTFWNRRIRS